MCDPNQAPDGDGRGASRFPTAQVLEVRYCKLLLTSYACLVVDPDPLVVFVEPRMTGNKRLSTGEARVMEASSAQVSASSDSRRLEVDEA